MFGLPGASGGSDSGPFLGRIQYDARSGFFTNVDRVQGADGGWENRNSEPYRGPAFAVDFGSLEVGFIKMGSPPVFLLTPFLGEGRTVYPQQPEEMAPAKPGERPRKAFSPGFRLKVMSSKTFGDGEPRYFSGTSKSLMGAVWDLYRLWEAAPEAAAGKIPLVVHDGTKTLETSGKHGTTKNYAPVFRITSWIDRPAGFGERTVPPPGGAMPAAPRPAPVQQAAAPPPAKVPAMAGNLDDDIPFAPECR